MSRDDVTETIAPDRGREGATPIAGVVVVFTEGVGVQCQGKAARAAFCVGRAEEADLVLDDPKASRKHARIKAAGNGVLVRDLGSHNGVGIDERNLRDDEAFAPAGATLRIGNSLLRVVADAQPYECFSPPADELVGGPALEDLRVSIRGFAQAPIPLLVVGETGVGKELVAHSLHQLSARQGQLVAVNCAAVPGELIEAELFGHAAGAFSGAHKARKGLVRSADGGTLFLDEIGEMPPEVQAKLLRVLETGEVRPVGEDAPTRVEVRLVSATNVDLRALAEAGGFRDDLYHRIAGAIIEVPPLRMRREDVPQLVAHFCALEGRADVQPSADAMMHLLAWHWPGNVRELRNAVRATLAKLDPTDAGLKAHHLPLELRKQRESSAADPQRAKLEQALAQCDGNVSEVARRLGMRRAGVYEQLRRLGIDPTAFRRR